MAKDYYEILGVAKNADKDAIKKAYRQMALKYHPDRNAGDQSAEVRFKEAAEAYSVLSDENKKARYDRFGHAGLGGHPGAGAGAGFHDINDIFSAFGDVFSDFFGGAAPGGRGRSRSRSRRGSDLRYFLEIDLKDVLSGLQTEIKFDTEEACKTCSGSGAKPGTSPQTCATCGGNGQVIRQQGFFTMATTCHACRGEGQTIADACTKCRGAGRTPIKRKLSINVPAGVDTGTQLRLSGEGETGFFGGGPGDLYVEVRVRDHDIFERNQQDLHAELEVSYLQAILGAELEVETLAGLKKVEVTSGSQSQDQVKLKGEGLPSVRSGTRGDLVYHLKVLIPKKLSKKEEALLREIAEEKSESVQAPSSFFGLKK